MTAIRVVDDHVELENSGQVSHADLDTFITGSAFLLVSGTGPLPPSARRLVAGTGITVVDQGPGGNLIISSSPGLPTPGFSGSVLFAVTTQSYVQSLPITTTTAGWLVNDAGYLLVSSSF